MSQKKVWLITGAGRGLGLDLAKAALAAGHAVAATGRDPAKVTAALGEHPDLFVTKLDVTKPEDAEAAVAATVERFGHLDVVLNNAGNFYAGFFEVLSDRQIRDQFETLLFGPMNVVRAALPVLRKQRSGLVLTISSTAGITGGLFCTAYAAAKFALEGWMESLTVEVSHFGIKTMLVEPGFFRTDLLTPDSTTYAEATIEDYVDLTKETVATWNSMNGKQSGDPEKLARAVIKLASLSEPPVRFAGGADAHEAFLGKAHDLTVQANEYTDLSSSLSHDDA